MWWLLGAGYNNWLLAIRTFGLYKDEANKVKPHTLCNKPGKRHCSLTDQQDQSLAPPE